MGNLNVLTNVGLSNHFRSIVAPAGLEAGYLMKLGAQNADGTFAVSAPAAITDKLVVMAVPVTLSYDPRVEDNDFVISAGDLVRAIVPVEGQAISIPVANITATATVQNENFVIIDAGAYKPECVATLGGTESVVYRITRTFTKVGVAMVELTCEKA